MLNLVIVDDNASIRENLTQIFSLFDEINVLAVFTDGDEVEQGFKALDKMPDVVIMDIEMKRMNGIEATRILKHVYPELSIVMLTVSEDNDHLFQAIDAGADGYLLKGEKPVKMLELIKLAQEGRFPMSPKVAGAAIRLMSGNASRSSLKKPEDYGISKRELDVLVQITAGKNYNQIAETLFISPQTVRTHTDNLYRKLGVHSKIEASKIALENKWT